MIPLGTSGKEFVLEMARLLTSFAERSSLEPITLQAVMTMPALLLQKPHSRSKAKDHIYCLKRCLETLKVGRIEELVHEGRKILLAPATLKKEVDKFNHTFARLVFGDWIKAAHAY